MYMLLTYFDINICDQACKTRHICTTTEIHFLLVHDALPRNIKYLTRSAFIDSFFPMLSNHEDAFFGPEGGLHGVPHCS